MAIPFVSHRIVTNSQQMSASDSPRSEHVLLNTPHDDDATLESSAHFVPSTRVIELETLLRQRDAQNQKLTVGPAKYFIVTNKPAKTCVRRLKWRRCVAFWRLSLPRLPQSLSPYLRHYYRYFSHILLTH
jgi:hypothetical protein